MTHEEKVELMFQDLIPKGIKKSTLAPPLYRFLWKLGVKISPPLFSSFIFLFLFQGIFFGILMGIFICAFAWIIRRFVDNSGFTFIGAIYSSVIGSIIFGLVMATYTRNRAKKYKLPLWKDYGSH
jgi:hypothetical protein